MYLFPEHLNSGHHGGDVHSSSEGVEGNVLLLSRSSYPLTHLLLDTVNGGVESTQKQFLEGVGVKVPFLGVSGMQELFLGFSGMLKQIAGFFAGSKGFRGMSSSFCRTTQVLAAADAAAAPPPAKALNSQRTGDWVQHLLSSEAKDAGQASFDAVRHCNLES